MECGVQSEVSSPQRLRKVKPEANKGAWGGRGKIKSRSVKLGVLMDQDDLPQQSPLAWGS